MALNVCECLVLFIMIILFIEYVCFSSLGIENKGNPSDRPVPPSTEYCIGYSCLPYTESEAHIGKNSCGIYFKSLVEVFEDGFWRPPIEASKRCVL